MFENETLTPAELQKAQESVAKLYQQLITHWHEIVDIPRPEELG
jgi:hypothetical protein